jgi:hypothetical protein
VNKEDKSKKSSQSLHSLIFGFVLLKNYLATVTASEMVLLNIYVKHKLLQTHLS